ncbi:MAG: family intrarane metalloprotease, partial [Citricoccus sp.]|nr:family intrarane metalloprotease [Citricoccus sp. WCRC_4]
DLRSRLFRWRVGVRWYAVALLTYPLLMTAILFPFWFTSEAFLPGIITAEDKASLLVAGLVAGLIASVFEEVGWTGFATAELRKRHGLLATGLIVGLPWALVHLPLYVGNASGAVPPALYVPVMLFFYLPYRVLMVWVYDRTQSVPMAMLMHLAGVVSGFVLVPAAMVGIPDLIFNLVFSAALWVLVAAVVAADRRERSRPGSESLGVRSTRGALPVFRPVGFPESPPEPGVPVVPAPGSPQVPLRTVVMVHPVAGHGVGMAVPR